MIYVAFKNKGNENLDKIKNSISLLMLIQPSSISAKNYFASPFFRTNISSKTKIQLSGFLACCETGQQSALIIQLPFEIQSDEHLLNWGDDYLGCFSLDIAKSELATRAQLFVDSISNKPLMGMWIQEYGLATSAIQNSDLPESEKKSRYLSTKLS